MSATAKQTGKPLEIDKRGAAKVVDAMENRAASESYAAIGRRHGWSPSTTRQIIANDVYLGIVRCGESCEGERAPCDRESRAVRGRECGEDEAARSAR